MSQKAASVRGLFRECPLWAHRIVSLLRGNLIALGVKERSVSSKPARTPDYSMKSSALPPGMIMRGQRHDH
jgi:hypothetical protein